MSNPAPHEVTQLLAEWSGGDESALDEALGELARAAPRQSRVVELRYFGGLSVEETARVLKVHPNTVLNDWREARAWLYCVLGEGEAS